MNAPPEIAVVGSLNLDISVPVPHLPGPGETVIGDDGLWSPGGKGGNQAVAAARLGRTVSMVGALGSDDAGDLLLGHLHDDGVRFDGVRLDVPSGLALITVATDGSGENAIAVSPGANRRLDARVVTSSESVRQAGVVLVQFEVPLECVGATVETATGLVIVNPAPAVPGARRAIAGAAVVVPNQGELAALVDAPPTASIDELADQARLLDTSAVVVTMGARGALIVAGGRVELVPAVPVAPVDTTAAGDTFCGALADAMVDAVDGQRPSFAELRSAVEWAVQVAAITVTRRGAQVSIPTRAEVLAALEGGTTAASDRTQASSGESAKP